MLETDRRARLRPCRTTTRSALLLALLATGSACQDPADAAIEAGDRYLAVGEVDAAIAEYKLGQRREGDRTDLLLRLGHAYAVQGDVDEALAYYEPLAEQRPEARHQIASDLVMLARTSRERGASENMARSLEPLLGWGLGFVPPDLQLALADHYGRDGNYPRSLSLYLATLAEETEPSPTLLYRTGRAYEELGGCDRALPYFERYVESASRRDPDRDAARWHYGNCLFQSADEERAAGRPRPALEKLDRMVELGVPRTLLDEAHFFRGEMLLSTGNPDAALAAYNEVLELNPSRTGSLVRRSEERIRQIRFGTE